MQKYEKIIEMVIALQPFSDFFTKYLLINSWNTFVTNRKIELATLRLQAVNYCFLSHLD